MKNPPGRPTHHKQAKTENVRIRITPDLRHRLEQEAFMRDTTLSKYVSDLLMAAHPGVPDPSEKPDLASNVVRLRP